MKLTNSELQAARNVLRKITKKSLFQSGRLHYAAEKNLRRFDQELGDFEKAKQELLEKHAEKDEEGRFIYRSPAGEEVIMVEEKSPAGGIIERPIYRESGESFLEQLPQDASPQEFQEFQERSERRVNQLAYTFANGNAEKYNEQFQELMEEEVDVQVHQVPETLLDREDANGIPFRHIHWMFREPVVARA